MIWHLNRNECAPYRIWYLEQKKSWSSPEVLQRAQICGNNKSRRLTRLSHEQEDRGASLWNCPKLLTTTEVNMHFTWTNCVLCHWKGPLIIVRVWNGTRPFIFTSFPVESLLLQSSHPFLGLSECPRPYITPFKVVIDFIYIEFSSVIWYMIQL